MHLTYNAINSQYAAKQSLPIWGDLEGLLRKAERSYFLTSIRNF